MRRRLSELRALAITDPLIVIATIAFASVSLAVSIFDPHKRRQSAIAAAWARALLGIGGVKVQPLPARRFHAVAGTQKSRIRIEQIGWEQSFRHAARRAV